MCSPFPLACIAGLAGPQATLRNFAVPGQTTEHMIADAATEIDPLVATPHNTAVLVAWEWCNDSPNEVQARIDRMVEYCQARRAAGWKVVVLTNSSRSAEDLIRRDDVTAYIRANWPSFADALADVAADPHIGAAGTYTDPTYFVDGVHMTTAGYDIVADIVRTQIEQLRWGSGVQTIDYSIDARAWTTGTSAFVEAPATHSWDGVHTIRYRAIDAAGNIEESRIAMVRIDTRGPRCTAPTTVRVARGRYATLRFRVSDALSPRARVRITVRRPGGKVLRAIDLGLRRTNRLLGYRPRCAFAPGSYRFCVRAVDLAGNRQVKRGVTILVVVPQSGAAHSPSQSRGLG